ncbi:hypothetical protein SBADM41S_06165 [Streptomyces badius]
MTPRARSDAARVCEARSSSPYVRVAAPVSTATASGVARNRSTSRRTSVADPDPDPDPAAGRGATAVAANSSWNSRSRRATVCGAKSRTGKFHEKRRAAPSCQHSRLSRVAAVAVPAAVGRTLTGHRSSRAAGKREKLKPAGPTVRGPDPTGSDGSSRARSRPVTPACRSLSSQIPASRSARAPTGSSGSVEHSRGRESASGPTSRSRPASRSSRRARATFTATSRCPLHRARQRTCTASSRWNRLTPWSAARFSNAAVSAGSRLL